MHYHRRIPGRKYDSNLDRAYTVQRIRHWLRRHRITAVIPPKKHRGKLRPGRPVSYNADHYRGGNVVERCVGWFKECRALATRLREAGPELPGPGQTGDDRALSSPPLTLPDRANKGTADTREEKGSCSGTQCIS